MVRIAVICLTLLISAAIFLIVNSGDFPPCPVDPKFTDTQKSTIASLESVIDLSIKLATALVGFGAAILIGFKSEVKLSPWMRVSITIATILFAQSALYAVWWRLGVSDVYLNECFAIIQSGFMRLRYQWHMYFFMAGLGAVSLIVLEALLRGKQKEMDT